MQMGLEILVGSVGDLADFDTSSGNDSNVNTSDDDWNAL